VIDYVVEQYTDLCKYLGINFCAPWIVLAIIVDISYYPFLKSKERLRNLNFPQKMILFHAVVYNIFLFWAYFSGRCALLTQ